jgi:hypothetical protein
MKQDASNVITLRVREISQLFNTLDPFPFRDRDISPTVDQYIVDWAEDLSQDLPIQIVVQLLSRAGEEDRTSDISNAISAWYSAKEKSETIAIRALFRNGRHASLIGITLLAACLFFAWRLSQNYNGPFAHLMQESFVIIGWVVIWRPVEIFLYDWIPLLRRRKLYRRLAASKVTVQTANGSAGEAA